MAKNKKDNTWKYLIVFGVLALLLFVGCKELGGGGQGGSGGFPSGLSGCEMPSGLSGCELPAEDEPDTSCKADWFTNHWECNGTCDEWNDGCVIFPVGEIPEYGFTNPDEKPNCACLSQQSGSCNWYDASYGQGSDNYQCGGTCPEGSTCTTWNENGKSYCNCKQDEPNQIIKCSDITQPLSQFDCDAGWCPTGSFCEYKFHIAYGYYCGCEKMYIV